MSVTMSKADGVTVLTLTTDPQSSCPPICQILKRLCYSPVCCSVSQHLKKVQKTSQSVLGALHFMVGLLNIGLGAILSSGGHSWWGMSRTLFPFWFGGVFMLFGIICILSEKCPSPCLVILSVILNLAGVALAIATIVLYTINLLKIQLWWMCDVNYDYSMRSDKPSPNQDIITERCLEGKALILILLRGMNVVLIVLSVLELCVTISSAVLGIKALRSKEKKESKSTEDPEHAKTIVEEVPSNSTV